MSTRTSSELRFGPYRLVPEGRALLAGGEAVKLGSRAFDALLVLVEHRERAVSKAELMERVWPKLVVEENNLQVQIAALRKVLGPAAIATIPGRGYRFTLPVETDELAASSRRPPAERPPAEHAPRDNLPQVPGPLYGRDTEVEVVGALLDAHALVCVVGSGGIGKTRLALAVAHARRHAYPDGAWLVELAPVSDPALVATEVARVLGFPSAGGRGGVDAIAAALADQNALLVLDNCEHLLEAVATLADTLSQRARGVRMLVTSQEPLKLAAEQVYRLDPLEVPTGHDVAHAERHGAVALFVGRAQAADPRFRLSEDNVAAVLEICRRLDGLPLALELAAARVRLLGVEGLRARLDERFNILTGGSRFVLRRHQTLRAALDFSHGLLDERERAVFRRLGVFAGSFGVESAQTVCADRAIDVWEVLEGLGTLVDKSLVVAQGGAEPRLHLLETTRAYALEKLGEADETREVLERHAFAVAARMRHAYDDFWALQLDDWHRRYVPDLDNLRAAIEWSLRHDSALAIELVGDSLKLWQELALHPEARRYCNDALALLTDQTPARAAGRLWYAQAMLMAHIRPAQSRDAARRAVALLRAAGDEAVLALALGRLAGWKRGAADPEQWDALRELEGLERPEWQGQLRWLPTYARAMVSRAAGQFAEAERCYTRAVEVAAEQGHGDADARSLINVAEVVLMQGRIDDAIRTAAAARARMASSRDRLFTLFADMTLFTALVIGGDGAAAREPLEAALPLLMRYDMAYRYSYAAALYATLRDDLPAAARLLGYADAAYLARDDLDPDPNEATARERATARVATLPAEQREAWQREGAALKDAEAYRLTLAAGEKDARRT